MRTILLLELVLALAAVIVSTQPDCEELGFGNLVPLPGSGLPVCVNDAPQCCTNSFVDRLKVIVRQRLEEFLREEYEDVVHDSLEELDNLLDYFDEDFTENLLQSIPFPALVSINSSDPSIALDFRNLRENFDIRDTSLDQFDASAFFRDLLSTYAARFLGQEEDAQDCIKSVVDSQINQDTLATLDKHLQELRKAISSLYRISRFLKRQRNRLETATVVDQCVTDFIDIAFCSRCTRKTPPMCFRTCSALLRGCYSPYYTALNKQYLPLWIEAQRIVRIANTTVNNILTSEAELIDVQSVVSELSSQCNIPTDGGRSRRHGDDMDQDGDNTDATARNGRHGMFIPFGLVDDLFEFSGAFEYDRRGLRLCIDALDNKDDCTSEEQQDDDSMYCMGEDICTSKCGCTDGTNFTTDSQTTRVFDRNDVKYQGDNPVFNVDQEMLDNQVEEIQIAGDPIAAFLSSDAYTSVSPEDLMGDDGDGDGDGDGDVIGSAPRVVALASFVVVLFSLMMSLLL